MRSKLEMLRDFNSKTHPALQAVVFSLKVMLLMAALAFLWEFLIKSNWESWGALAATDIEMQTFDDRFRSVATITFFAVVAMIAPTYTLYRYIVRRDLAEAQIKHMATHDTLTDIPNRCLFFDRLEHAMANANRHKEKLAVLFVDLDGFKTVNDTLGHDAGDHILKTTAKRLTAVLRETDTVARFGGDEFAAVLTEVKDTAKIEEVISKLKAEIASSFTFKSRVMNVQASIGYALYPDHSDSVDQLVCLADRSMYADKKRQYSKPGVTPFTAPANDHQAPV